MEEVCIVPVIPEGEREGEEADVYEKVVFCQVLGEAGGSGH